MTLKTASLTGAVSLVLLAPGAAPGALINANNTPTASFSVQEQKPARNRIAARGTSRGSAGARSHHSTPGRSS
jgi:hypothetical protein